MSIILLCFCVLMPLVAYGQDLPFNSVPGEVIVKLKYPSRDLKSAPHLTQKSLPASIIERLKVEYPISEITPFGNPVKNNIRPIAQKSVNQTSTKIPQLYLIKTSEDVSSFVKKISDDHDVEYAQPNYLYQLTYTPSDELFDEQWAHQLTNAEAAWDITLGDSNREIIVAMIDSGVDYLHEDLAENIWRDANNNPGMDFVDIDTSIYQPSQLLPGEDYTGRDYDTSDYLGHGTHCAGIIAAIEGNGKGVVGVAPRTLIMPLRVGFSIFNVDVELGVLDDKSTIDAIYYAIENGADILNMSFVSLEASPALKEALDEASARGIISIAAAGNANDFRKMYPAAFDNVISVSATTINDEKANFSNYNPDKGEQWIDIAAPGGDTAVGPGILSTVPSSGGVLTHPSGYLRVSGTSMATPYMAGVAALAMSMDEGLVQDEFIKIVQEFSDPLDSGELLGKGRVNVKNALGGAFDLDFTINPYVRGTVPIAGIANFTLLHPADVEFKEYKLTYAPLKNPNQKTVIFSSSQPAIQKKYMGDFDTTGIPDGKYIVQLTIVSTLREHNFSQEVIIDNYPEAPDIINLNDTIVVLGEKFEFELQVEDLDQVGGSISVTAEELPDGASFDEQTRIFSWVPDESQKGKHKVSFRVTDGEYEQIQEATFSTLFMRNKVIDSGLPGRVKHPHIDGDHIVWQHVPGTFVYDLSSDIKKEIISQEAKYFLKPVVSKNKVVMYDLDIFTAGIYLYDIDSKSSSTIVNDEMIHSVPSIDENYAVWITQEGSMTSTGKLQIYNLETNQRKIIAETLDDTHWPGPDISGNHVIWNESKGEAWALDLADNIFLYDLSTDQKTQLTNNDFMQTDPAIFEDKAIWLDSSQYFDSASISYGADLVLYDLNQRSEIMRLPSLTKRGSVIVRDVVAPDIHEDNIVYVKDNSLFEAKKKNEFEDYEIRFINANEKRDFKIAPFSSDQSAFQPKIYNNKIVYILADKNNIFHLYLTELFYVPTVENVTVERINEQEIIRIRGEKFGFGGEDAKVFFDTADECQVKEWSDSEIVCERIGSNRPETIAVLTPGGQSNSVKVNLNHPPEFMDLNLTPSVGEGRVLEIEVKTNDDDGDTINVTLEGNENYDWISLTKGNDSENYLFRLEPKFGDTGTYEVTLTADDQRGGVIARSITVEVTEVNRYPTIHANDTYAMSEGETLIITATDADGDKVSLLGEGLQSWMSTSNHEFHAEPKFAHAGEYTFTLNAEDGRGGRTSKEIAIKVNDVNQAPELVGLEDLSLTEGEVLEVVVRASDKDGDVPQINVNGIEGHNWMNFEKDENNENYTFTLDPKFGDAGNYKVTFTADDQRGGLDTQEITIQVNDGDKPTITLSSLKDERMKEGEVLTFFVQAESSDGSAITFRTSGLKEWMEFNPGAGSGVFIATPTFTDAGEYTVTFTVSIDSGATMTETVHITVDNVNRAPVLRSIGSKSVDEGKNLTFEISAFDDDLDSVSISASPLENWMDFRKNTNSAKYSFTLEPNIGDDGIYHVTFTATDGDLEDSEVVLITVGDVNQPPSIESIDDVNMVVGDHREIVMNVSDPDSDDVPEVSASGIEGYDWMDFNAVTNTFIIDPESGHEGVYEVIFTVDDKRGGIDTEDITVTVTAGNLPPVIEPLVDVEMREDGHREVVVSVSDSDGDELEVSVSGIDGHEDWMSFDQETLTFKLNPKFDHAGRYEVTFTADDKKGGIDTEEIVISVLNVNRTPEFVGLENQSVEEDKTLEVVVKATDPDGDDPEIRASGIDQYGWMEFNEQTDTFIAVPKAGDAGVYHVIFTADDGYTTHSQTVVLSVTEAEVDNHPPKIETIADVVMKENQHLEIVINASDPDGTTPQIRIEGIVSPWMTRSGNTINLDPKFEHSGEYQLIITATDGELTATEKVSVQVDDVNRPPEFLELENQSVEEGKTLEMVVKAIDPDGNDPEIRASGIDQYGWMEFNEQTDTFIATPKAGDAGVYHVIFTADDGYTTHSQTVVLSVTEAEVDNHPPKIETIADVVMKENQHLEIVINASDPDGSIPEIRIEGIVSPWMTRSGNTINLDPKFEHSGEYQLIITATDGELTATEKVSVQVDDVNRAPIIDIPDIEVMDGQEERIEIIASDPDGDGFTITAKNGLITEWMELKKEAQIGKYTFRASPKLVEYRVYQVTLTASDEKGAQTHKTFTIFISPGASENSPPVLNEIPDQAVNAGDELSFTLSARDIDNDTLRYSSDNLPPASMLDEETGEFRWFTVKRQIGTYNIMFTVTDDEDATDTITVNISIAGASDTAAIYYPENDAPLSKRPITFRWTPGIDATQYWLFVGSEPGADDIIRKDLGQALSTQVDFPLTGDPVYLQIWSKIYGEWQPGEIIKYDTAVSEPDVAEIRSPQPGTKFDKTKVLFRWNKGTNVTRYWLFIGLESGEDDLVDMDLGTINEAEIPIPLTGEPIFVQLWSKINGEWLPSDPIEYDTINGIAQIVSPDKDELLGEVPVEFTWTQGIDVDRYWFYIGSEPGGDDIVREDMSSNLSGRFNFEITDKPVYAQIWSKVNGIWIGSRVVEYQTALQAGFHHNININVREEVRPVSGYSLNMSKDVYGRGDLRLYTSSLKYVLDYLWDFSEGSLSSNFDMNQLEAWANYYMSDHALSVADTLDLLQHFGPFIEGSDIVWKAPEIESTDEALFSLLVSGIITPWGEIDGVPFELPTLVQHASGENPLSIVKGVHTTVNPSESPQFGINSFWMVNAGEERLLGKNVFAAAHYLSKKWRDAKAIVGANTPAMQGYATEEVGLWSDGEIENNYDLIDLELPSGAAVYFKKVNPDDVDVIKGKVWSVIQKQVLTYDKGVREIFKNTKADAPLLLSGESHDFILVPFITTEDGGVVAAAILNFDTGTLLELTWSETVLKDYLPVKMSDAAIIVKNHLNVEGLNGAEFELLHVPGDNIYYPTWKVYFQGKTFMVNQSGDIQHIE